MLAQDGEDGDLRRRCLLFGLFEDRAFEDGQADEQADAKQQHAEQEGDAPAPAQKGGLLHRGGEVEDTVGEQQADRHAGLHPAGMEAAPALVAVFDRHQHRAAPLAADAEAPGETQQHQQHGQGCRHADLLIGRQQADEHGGHAHEHEGGDQHGLATDLVAIVPEDNAAERAPLLLQLNSYSLHKIHKE